MIYRTSPSFLSPVSALDIRPRSSRTPSDGHVDIGDEGVGSRDTLTEFQGRRRHLSNDERLSGVFDSRTSAAAGTTSSVPRNEASSFDGRMCSAATSPNVGTKPKPKPKLPGDDGILSIRTAVGSSQRSIPTRQTPSSDAEPSSDPDNCSDVWVPRTSSAAESVSGIWIVCEPTSAADSLRSARSNFGVGLNSVSQLAFACAGI